MREISKSKPSLRGKEKASKIRNPYKKAKIVIKYNPDDCLYFDDTVTVLTSIGADPVDVLSVMTTAAAKAYATYADGDIYNMKDGKTVETLAFMMAKVANDYMRN